MVMMLFGGMSKAERTRVQLRVQVAMADMAERTDRFLGGRPPYGYSWSTTARTRTLPKAAAGQVGHRLEVDPLAAPVVQRIFRMYVDGGHSFRSIAQILREEGIPSPSAHDPARNRHRDGRGWAFSAVRAILGNPTYAGRRVWGRQEKFESLLDPSDVAAGSYTRMRWKEKEAWIWTGRVTHPAIVDDHLVTSAERLLSARVSPDGPVSDRPTIPTLCAGYSSAVSAARQCRALSGSPGVMVRGECSTGARSVAAVRCHQNWPIIPQRSTRDRTPSSTSSTSGSLSLASAEVLTAGQLPEPSTDHQRAALGRRLTDTRHKISA